MPDSEKLNASKVLQQLNQKRDALLDKLTAALEADPRIAALWLTGSFGRDENDEWSDLDLHVPISDEHFNYQRSTIKTACSNRS
jgi:predicted nucleotidyltransferase